MAKSRPRIGQIKGAPTVLTEDVDQGVPAATTREVRLKPLSYYFTMPPPDDYYLIRKEQIDGLMKPSKDSSFDIALASGGAAVGLFQNVVSAIRSLWNATPPSLWDCVASVAFIALTTLAITKYLQSKSGSHSAEALKTQITSGQKVPVGDERQNQDAL